MIYVEVTAYRNCCSKYTNYEDIVCSDCYDKITNERDVLLAENKRLADELIKNNIPIPEREPVRVYSCPALAEMLGLKAEGKR